MLPLITTKTGTCPELLASFSADSKLQLVVTAWPDPIVEVVHQFLFLVRFLLLWGWHKSCSVWVRHWIKANSKGESTTPTVDYQHNIARTWL